MTPLHATPLGSRAVAMSARRPGGASLEPMKRQPRPRKAPRAMLYAWAKAMRPDAPSTAPPLMLTPAPKRGNA